MNKARFIKTLINNERREATLYELTPPYHDPDNYKDTIVYFVVVSRLHESMGFASTSLRLDETYMFPGNELGDILSYLEMPGSMQGADISDATVLGNIGYEIKEDECRSSKQ